MSSSSLCAYETGDTTSEELTISQLMETYTQRVFEKDFEINKIPRANLILYSTNQFNTYNQGTCGCSLMSCPGQTT